MEPNKNIPRFCFESPWLRTFSFEMSSVDVTAGERRIRATWTPELAQDLGAYHNIDVEDELTRLLSEQIAEQINRNTINTITQDLVAVQPMDAFTADAPPVPQGRLMYLDYQFDLNENFRNPIVYKDGSWSEGNTFEGVIGIKSEIKSHTLI